jgi:hypothetical protein
VRTSADRSAGAIAGALNQKFSMDRGVIDRLLEGEDDEWDNDEEGA